MPATIDQLHKEILALKQAVLQIQSALRAQTKTKAEHDEGMLEVADDVLAEVQAARKRKHTDFLPHSTVMKHYKVQ